MSQPSAPINPPSHASLPSITQAPGESMTPESFQHSTEQPKSQNPVPSIDTLHSPDIAKYRPKNLGSVLHTIWIVFTLPILSWSYLMLCFVIDHKTIKVSIWNVDDTVAHTNVIKAGITSVTILIITLALLPLKSLLGDLQSEEFFRVLTLKRTGVPLSVINQISTPSYGFLDKLSVVVRRKSSSAFAGAFLASLIAVIASTLAPATMSVQVVRIDDNMQGIRVGAIYRDSVWESTERGVSKTDRVEGRINYAAILPWLEHNLQMNYTWQSPDDSEDGFVYAVPTPLDLPVQTPTRYITDLIKFKPTCKWHAPDLSKLNGVTDDIRSEDAEVPKLRWRVSILQKELASYAASLVLYNLSPGVISERAVRDAQGDSIADGSSLWHFSKCVPAGEDICKSPLDRPGIVVFDDVPTTTYVTSFNQTFLVSFLVCRPNALAETREIRTSVTGKMTVVPSDITYTKQNNIYPAQARALLSLAMQGLLNGAIYTGPNLHPYSGIDGIGGAAHLQLLFGNDVALQAPDDLQFIVRPIEEITNNYAKMLQSILKPFLDGSLAHGYVPARTIGDVLIFTTSRPHLYVSVVVFTVLSIFVVAAHFRSPVPQFTFVAVASSVNGSEVPGILEDIRYRDGDGLPEDTVVKELRDRPIVLEGEPGQSPTTIRLG